MNIFIFLVFFILVANGQDEFPIKVALTPRVAAEMMPEQILKNSFWDNKGIIRNTEWCGRFTDFRPNGPKRKVQTVFQTCYNNRFLFIRVKCYESMMKKVNLSGSEVPVDSHDVFSKECLEFFIDQNHSHSKYYQIVVNIVGNVYDSFLADNSWNSEIIVKTEYYPDFWVLIAAIEWSKLGITPNDGKIIGFNLCRDRYVDISGKEWTNWAQTPTNFHKPQVFGHLLLLSEKMNSLEKELRKGGRQGEIVFQGDENKAYSLYHKMVNLSFRECETLFKENKGELGKISIFKKQFKQNQKNIKKLKEINRKLWKFRNQFKQKYLQMQISKIINEI